MYAVNWSEITLLALYDVSAAIDMVDHEILLERLETSNGLKGISLCWFRSYVSEGSQMIITDNSRTHWVHAKLKVTRGSVLGRPPLFILCTADISLLPTCGLLVIFLLITYRCLCMVRHLPS